MRERSAPAVPPRAALAGALGVGLALASGGPAVAADPAAGRAAAGPCAVCHGGDGIATNPEAPNLAGEAAIYIEKQLQAFKRGERQHRQMSIVAAALDDDTIRDLAAWYEAMRVTVEVPEL